MTVETSLFHLFPKALRRPLSVVIDVGAYKDIGSNQLLGYAFSVGVSRPRAWGILDGGS
jgi:fatty acid/phospholipid biosynthesis enzyme